MIDPRSMRCNQQYVLSVWTLKDALERAFIAYSEFSIAFSRKVWLYDRRLASGTGTGMGMKDYRYLLLEFFVARKIGRLVQFQNRTA